MDYLWFVLLTIGAFQFQKASGQEGTSCNCGWVNKGRIVGGKTAAKHQFPWMASLYDENNKEAYCGATIVSKYHAITAAHCGPYFHSTKSSLIVGLDDTNSLIHNQNTDAVKIGVEKLVSHPEFSLSTGFGGHDVAVIVTTTEIPFSTNVGPACFPTGSQNLDNEKAIAMGWGQTGFHESLSSKLKYVNQTVIPREKCLEWVSTVTQLQGQICGLGTNEGTCSGDSGGPLVWLEPETKRYTLVGVTSFGQQCKFPPPTVFTDVGAYVNWILDIIKENKPEQLCTKQKAT